MNSSTSSRRTFLQFSGLSAAAALLVPASVSGAVLKKTANPAQGLKLGLASYSLRKFNAADTVNMCRRAGLPNICLKSMHLPLESTPAGIETTIAMFRQNGVNPYACGVVYMNTEAEVEQAFRYAATAGMQIIVGVPAHSLLPLVERKVQEHNIKVAIHNHGPGDEVYPTAKSIYDRIKSLDSRIGICLDIGHTLRLGIDPTRDAETYYDRLIDVHIKDVDKAASDGDTVEIGRGIIDIPAFLQLLVKKQYSGVVSFEYEKDENDPMPGLCESVGYVRGVLRMLGA